MDREYKKLVKELGQRLVEVSKETESEDSVALAQDLIRQGAEVNFSRSSPMRFATKNYNFPLIRYFINIGALAEPLSRTYIAGMCQQGAFDEEVEAKFFEALNHAISKTGFTKDYIEPYFKVMLLAGCVDKAKSIGEKYNVSLKTLLANVPLNVVIECLELKRDISLELINLYEDRRQDAFDAAVAGGREKALEYLYERNIGFVLEPNRDSVLKAIMNGYMGVLHMLDAKGVDMRGDWCLVTAARVFNLRPEPLKFLLKRYRNDISEAGMDALKKVCEQENNEALRDFLFRN